MNDRSLIARRVAAVGLLGMAMLWGSARVDAQRWGRPSAPREGACFYREPNFRGEYFCAGVGQDVLRVPDDMNDEISSIRTFGNTEVTIFQDERFRGRSERFGGDIRNLAAERWNDRLSSFRIRAGFDGPRDRFQSRNDRPGDRERDRERFNVDAERIVRRAYEDILDRDPDTAGLRLYRSRIIDDGWTERQVRDALRNSPEYREKNTMTRAKAEEIVRRAYLSVLGREPDPGSRTYVEQVFRGKATEQDVIRALRASDEYRYRPDARPDR